MDSIYIKTKIFSGDNSLSSLSEIKNQRIWIVCDSFLVKNKSIYKVLKEIDNSNEVNIFDEVVPDPTISVVGKGLAMFKKINPDVVIAFGGGSAIDTAKGVLYFVKSDKQLNHAKLIAIPTTSGTGSEVSSATVIRDTEENTKYSIFDDSLLPDEAILDPEMTLTVPQAITANTGFDVFTHALEAYVAKNANSYSDALAEKAIELVIKNLLNCYFNGTEKNHRAAMQEASTLAGIAFNIAGLGISHSIAHQLGGVFHIPHGLANAIALPWVIEFNSRNKAIQKKYAQIAYKVGMTEREEGEDFAVKVIIAYIKQLKQIMSMTNNLQQYGISKEDFAVSKQSIIEKAMHDICTVSNPVDVSENDLEKLLDSLY